MGAVVEAGADDREARRARRVWLREHHPDHGGDLATFLAGPPSERAAAPAQDVRFYRAPRGVRRVLHPVLRRVARRRAPRRVV